MMTWIKKVGWKFTIAEDLQDNDFLTRSTHIGGAGFDSQWDSFYFGKLNNIITLPNDTDTNV